MNILDILRKFFKPATKPTIGDSLATTMLTMHNTERARRALPNLKLNDKLSAAATQHAQWMNDTKQVSHVGAQDSSVLDRIQQHHYQAKSIGENIAAGFQSGSNIMAAWMCSSGHRRNIFGNYEEIGIGKIDDCWCVIFATPKGTEDDDTVIINYGGALNRRELF